MKMTDSLITALVREYAEQTDGSSADIAYIKAIAENALRFLLRRYCLVEKSKVEEEYAEARIFCENVDSCGESYARNEARMFLLERLFPEIEKEAE